MKSELPSPIGKFLAANARLDLDGMLSPFARDAVVFADGGRHEGYAGIKALFEEKVIPVKAVFTPDRVRRAGDQVIAEGPAHGDFSGSPIRFAYRFTLDDDAIKALEITA